MKKHFGILLVSLVTLASRADLITNLTVTASPGTAIADANKVGVVSHVTVSGMFGYMTDIQVALNITGGFNGDLYAYLISPQGSMIVLLNRVGLNSANPFGYSDAGFNITLQAAGFDIHDYGSHSPTFSSGQLTGVWMPDRRMIDGQSPAGYFDAAGTGNNLDSLYGSDPNGDWTLFVADLSSPGQSTLVSWGLTIATVPEPQTWALLVGGGLMLLVAGRHRQKTRI
jgi:subtilisin-like proprotein convertase family protein